MPFSLGKRNPPQTIHGNACKPAPDAVGFWHRDATRPHRTELGDMIPDEMHRKAHELIAADGKAAFQKANPKPPRAGRRYKSYSIPARSVELIKAMDKGDAEAVAAIILNQFNHTLSEAEL